MTRSPWSGVIPAITTPFRDDLSIDHTFLAKHAAWLIESGCSGLVVCGSLGEGATLSYDEKLGVVETCVGALGPAGFVGAAVSALSTAEAVRFARDAAAAGATGLMVLPPYVYSTDWHEMRRHVADVIDATELPCMLYNNPIAYRTDFLPEQVAELAEAHDNLVAMKESSTDLRRITALRSLMGARLLLSVGVDDLVMEAAALGADGWVAGVVNALPRECVQLFELAQEGALDAARELYAPLLPLMRMDTVPKFVQLIKLLQECSGTGSARVRPPRLELQGQEHADAVQVIERFLENRSELSPAL